MLVSVVVPVFNGERHLGQALESVLAQSHRELEVIVVDDGSVDSSAAIATQFGGRVQVIRQRNQGVSAARNAGIALAGGEVVAFLDQDDWWLRDKLARQVQLFAQDACIGLVYTAVSFYDDDRKCAVPDPHPNVRRHELSGNCYESLLLHNPIVNSSVAVRRAAVVGVGGCDTQMGGNTVQDYDLWLRIAKAWRCAHVSEPLTVYRLHGAQGCHDHVAMFRDTLGVLLKQRTESEWRATQTGRRRLAEVHDALATAYFERGEPAAARRHFGKALSLSCSRRSAARFGASCLPYMFAAPLRRAWQGSGA